MFPKRLSISIAPYCVTTEVAIVRTLNLVTYNYLFLLLVVCLYVTVAFKTKLRDYFYLYYLFILHKLLIDYFNFWLNLSCYIVMLVLFLEKNLHHKLVRMQ